MQTIAFAVMESTVSPPAAPARPSRVQMADIARLANVSISTVSRALGNHPRISEPTRRRIHELATSLHYEVDAGAQMLRGKALQTVAVAFPYHAMERRHFKDPFFMALIGAIGDALIDSGHSMLIVPVDAGHFDRATRPYETRQAIGTLALGQERDHHHRLNALALRGLPFVVWGAQLPDQLYCSVGSDNLMGGVQATAHLLDCGARRIAFFGDPALPEVGQRQLGYLKAHQARGLRADARLMRAVDFSADAVRAEVERLLHEATAFDAVFACSDRMAASVVAALGAHGLAVPRDVQVVGFDDIEAAATALPPLTSVHQAVDVAGQAMVERLLAQLRGEAVESLVLPTTLVVRASTRAAVA